MFYPKFFLRDGIQDNHRTGNSGMKPVDAVEFQKIKSVREGKNDESDNFEMKILNEVALDKALEVAENF